MRIKESIIIDRSKEIVWEHIHDPKFIRNWNPRVHSFESENENLPSLDYKFNIVYEILAKPGNYEGVIIKYQKNKRLIIKYLNKEMKNNGYIIEGFELSDTRSGTKLCHFFNLEYSGVNIFLRILLYIFGILARPIGKRYLSSLKTTIEH